MEKASYYRARLKAFEQVIREEAGGDRDEKNNHSVILRNGVVPGGLEKRMDRLIGDYQPTCSNNDLMFAEITRFNTWFEMHPEKVAGTEVITTSREFPITIKGDKADIIKTITPINDNRDKRIRIARSKAIARKRMLKLMTI